MVWLLLRVVGLRHTRVCVLQVLLRQGVVGILQRMGICAGHLQGFPLGDEVQQGRIRVADRVLIGSGGKGQ